MKKRFIIFLIFLALICGTILSSAITLDIKERYKSSVVTSEQSKLNKKSALFVGDSICAAGCEINDATYGGTIGWAGRIGVKNNMTYKNASVSGASYSTCRIGNRIIKQVESSKNNAYEIVVMQGGVNDAWDNATLGETAVGYELASFNQDTFCGGLEATICKVKEYFPNAKVGYIVTFKTSNAEASWGITGLKDENTVRYFTKAKEICDKWGIPYLDFYFDDDFNNNKMQVMTKNYLIDYVHPNSEGYNLLSPIIERWMEVIIDESSFRTMYGASIRYEAPVGLRFSLAMTADKKDAILNDASKKLGMFIFPSEKLKDVKDYKTFDFAGLTKKLKVEFSAEDFYQNEDNDKMSGIAKGWYVNGVVSEMYIQNYGVDFVAVGYISSTIGEQTTYEYSSIIASHNFRSIAQVASESYSTIGCNEDTLGLIIEKAVYAVYGVKETRTNEGVTFNADGKSYDTYVELKTAKPITIGVTSPNIKIAEGESSRIDAFFKVGETKIASVKNINFRYALENETLATINNETILAKSDGNTTITVKAGKYSTTINLTIAKSAVVIEGVRDEYSHCYDITNQADGSAIIAWPLAGTVKAQWAKTEALVTNYDSVYKYLKISITSEKTHSVGIYYAPEKFSGTETCLKDYENIPVGTTVWYILMPSNMAESFELRYFIDTTLSGDTGSVTLKAEFVKEKEQPKDCDIGKMQDLYDHSYAITNDSYGNSTINWTAERPIAFARTESIITNYKNEYRYLKITVNTENAYKLGVYYANQIGGATETELKPHTSVSVGSSVMYIELPTSMAESFELRLYHDAGLKTAGSVKIQLEFTKNR